MSTIAVNAITDAAGGNTATINGMTPTADSLQGFRNRIINGDMRIDQRNAGASVTPAASTYTLDRFRLFIGAASKLSVQQSTDAPAGFSNSTVITVASSYTPSSTEQFFYGTSFEANNIGDFAFGTASASSAALSFWVKSSVTGTYSFSWTNNANDRSYIGTFAINSVNTWEYKTVIIPGDTTGTWANAGTGRHSFIQIGLGCGSTFESTAGSWQAGNLRQTAGSVDFVSQTTGATFYITGVQLEAGSVATPFERRDYGRELIMCQRYYQTGVLEQYRDYALQNRQGQTSMRITTMRATPTVTQDVLSSSNAFSTTFVSLDNSTVRGGVNPTSFGAVYTGARIGWTADAEL